MDLVSPAACIRKARISTANGWRLMVEKATVDTDGKLTFTLRNGMEIEV